MVNRRATRCLTVHDGVLGNAWARGISGELTVDTIVQYLKLWVAVAQAMTGFTDRQDEWRWKWRQDGKFSAKSAYLTFFKAGSVPFPGMQQLWKTFAPLRFKFFGWLALRGRCWSADRMRRHVMTAHTACPLCSIHDESLDHLLVRCPFSRAIWFRLLQRHGWLSASPTESSVLLDWWSDVADRIPTPLRRYFCSFALLTMRSIWLQRNARVFGGDIIPAHSLLEIIDSEWRYWILCRSRPVRALP
ncbi:hypothetical protein ACQ4PT_046070 [Festuca glaucescens]